MGDFSAEEAWQLWPGFVRCTPIHLNRQPLTSSLPAELPCMGGGAVGGVKNEHEIPLDDYAPLSGTAGVGGVEKRLDSSSLESAPLSDQAESAADDVQGHSQQSDSDAVEDPEVEPPPTPVYDGTGVGLLYDRRMTRHRILDGTTHPEQPLRLVRIFERLKAEGLVRRCIRVPCRSASRNELELKHTAKHVDAMLRFEHLSEEDAARAGETYNSFYACPESTQAGLLSAGSVVEAVSRVCTGDLKSAACVVRPPGHHAERDCAMGFCMFGNVAVAAAEARKQRWSRRTLIVDWDVHHGNGTQRMFDEDDTVLFFSVHRYDNGRFYPSGPFANYTSHGVGGGVGFSVNMPWDVAGGRKRGCPAPGDAEYVHAFTKLLLPIAADFSPDLVIVSAGFDSAEGDPLGECRITPEGFHELTRQLMGLADGRIVVALEGGYNLESISSSMAACVHALLGDPAPRAALVDEASAVSSAPHGFHMATVEKVRQHFAQFWPSLRAPGEEFNVPEVRVPAASLKGSLEDMEKALRECVQDTGVAYDVVKRKQQASLFKLEEVPAPAQQPSSGQAGRRELRASLGRNGAEPPYVLPVILLTSTEQAVQSASLAFQAGVHGVWLLNTGHAHSPPEAALQGKPAPQRTGLKAAGGPTGKAGRAQLSALAESFAAVREQFPDLWVGLNVPQLPPAQVFKWVAAHCPTADAVWLDDLPCSPAQIVWQEGQAAAEADEQPHRCAVRLDKWLTDAQPALKAVRRERQSGSWLGLVFGTIAGMQQERVHHEQDDETMGETCQALLHHWASLASSVCDVVVTSSAVAGRSCSVAKLRAMGGTWQLALFGSGDKEDPSEAACMGCADAVFADCRGALGAGGEKTDLLEFDPVKLRSWAAHWRT